MTCNERFEFEAMGFFLEGLVPAKFAAAYTYMNGGSKHAR